MQSSLAPPSSPSRVLVLIGARRAREAVVAELARDGHELVVADTIAAAFRAIEEAPPDVALLDFDLEGVMAACDRIAKSQDRTCVILVRDGLIDEQRAARGFASGADDVTDSRRPTELRARVRLQAKNKFARDRLAQVLGERDHLRREASLDPLTQLSNFRAVSRAISRLVAEKQPFSLLRLDVDHFQSIKDDLGAGACDVALSAIAQSLRASVRGDDVCGRRDGEELVIVLARATQAIAEQVAERHRLAVASMSIEKLEHRKLTVSIGVATYDPERADVNDAALLHRADEAVRAAKHAGCNRVVVADAPLERASGLVLAAPPIDDRDGEIERELLRGLAETSAVPVLPEACQRVLESAHDPRIDLARLAGFIDKEPGLAARVLATANAAYYSRAERVTSTLSAIVTIGLSATRDLLFQIVHESTFRGIVRFRADVTRSYQRSVTCAFASRVIARAMELDVEYSYLAGLLHDLGEARIYRVLSNIPRATDEQARVLVARHHAQAGAELATIWRLPEEVRAACALHHEHPAREGAIVRHVNIADLVCDLIQSGRAAQNLTPEERERADACHVKTADLASFIAATRTSMSERRAA